MTNNSSVIKISQIIYCPVEIETVTCSKCLNLALIPHRTYESKKIFCLSCSEKLNEKSYPCTFTLNCFTELRVSCFNSSFGCKVNSFVSEILFHQKSCDYGNKLKKLAVKKIQEKKLIKEKQNIMIDFDDLISKRKSLNMKLLFKQIKQKKILGNFLTPILKETNPELTNECELCSEIIDDDHSEYSCCLNQIQIFQNKMMMIIHFLQKKIIDLHTHLIYFSSDKIIICEVCRNFGCEGSLERCDLCGSYICPGCKKISTKNCSQCKGTFCVLCFYISGETDYYESHNSTKISFGSSLIKDSDSFLQNFTTDNNKENSLNVILQKNQELVSITEEDENNLKKPCQNKELTPLKNKNINPEHESKIKSKLSSWRKTNQKQYSALNYSKFNKFYEQGNNFYISIKNYKIDQSGSYTRDLKTSFLSSYINFSSENKIPNYQKSLDLVNLSNQKKGSNQKEKEKYFQSSDSKIIKRKINYERRGEKILRFKNQIKDIKDLNTYSRPYEKLMEEVEGKANEEGIKGNKHYFNNIDITNNENKDLISKDLLNKSVCFVCNINNRNKQNNKIFAKKTPLLSSSPSVIRLKMKTSFD